MKRLIFLVLVLSILAGCSAPAQPTPTATLAPSPSATEPEATEVQVQTTETDTPVAVTETATTQPTQTEIIPTVTIAPSYPPEGYGPVNFPSNINPLTGLPPASQENLNRRPVIIKIENLPREHRPHWGLSFADIIYEYYTEYGNVRFAAVFYGNNSQQVGTIRSARWFDVNLIRMFKAIFAFGSCYVTLRDYLFASEFSNQLILENGGLACPALCFTPIKGYDYLLANTYEMNAYLAKKKIDNSKQNLDGMVFKQDIPAGGTPGAQVYVRFSGAIYNRWDYDPTTGKYLRFVDMQDDSNRDNPVYGALTDRTTGKQIAMDNVVILLVNYFYKSGPDKQIFDVNLTGEGEAFIARDGKLYPVRWRRASQNDMLTLIGPDGNYFPFKPGTTWFEAINIYSIKNQETNGWSFSNVMP